MRHRKIILYIATSLDGYIARSNDNIDWLFHDQDYGYKDFYDSIDTILIGRKTFEVSLSFEKEPFSGKKCYVFSKSMNYSENQVITIKNNLVDKIKEIQASPGKDIWLIGGAEIIEVCQKSRLIDEYIISIHPIILGQGIPLFKPINSEIQLRFVESKSFSTGLLQIKYIQN